MTFASSFWMPGQPDNWGEEPGEDCGQVVGYSGGRWNDDKCTNKTKYICKRVNRECRVRAQGPGASSVMKVWLFFFPQPIRGPSAT